MAVYKSESYTPLLEMPLRKKKAPSQEDRVGVINIMAPGFNIFKYASHRKSKEVTERSLLEVVAAPNATGFILLFITPDTEGSEGLSPTWGHRLTGLS